MLTLQDILQVGATGLIAHKTRMSVVSHNVVNVNTPGYHRQRAVLETQPPLYGLDSLLNRATGTGVRVAAILRDYDELLESILRGETSSTSAHSRLAQSLGDLESILAGDGATNLSVYIQQFWTAWQDLANNADSMAARQVVVQRARALAQQFNNLHYGIEAYRAGVISGTGASATGALARDVATVNDLATQIASLNQRIFLMSARGNNVNDLQDKRDTLILQLSEKVGVQVTYENDNTCTIRLDGQDLVTGSTANALSITGDDPVELTLNGVVVTPTSGTLAAWAEVVSAAGGLLDDINTLAEAFIDQVNTLHLAGYDLYGLNAGADYAPPHSFFTGLDASDIAVNADIAANPAYIAAAATRHSAGPPPMANLDDGAQALAIADLCTTRLVGLNNQAFGDFFAAILTTIGARVEAETTLAENGEAVVASINASLLGSTGVNLDEEMVEMLSAQRAFQAAAKIVATADSMLDTVINKMAV